MLSATKTILGQLRFQRKRDREEVGLVKLCKKENKFIITNLFFNLSPLVFPYKFVITNLQICKWGDKEELWRPTLQKREGETTNLEIRVRFE